MASIFGCHHYHLPLIYDASLSAANATTWGTNFWSDSGFSIIGTHFSVGSNKLIFTNLDRMGTDIAKHTINGTTGTGTFKYYTNITVSSATDTGALICFGYYHKNYTVTNGGIGGDNCTSFEVYYNDASGYTLDYFAYRNGVSLISNYAGASITTGVSYHCMGYCEQVGSTYIYGNKVWTSSGSESAPDVVNASATDSNTPSQMIIWAAMNADTLGFSVTMTGYFAGYSETFPYSGAGSGSAPTFTSVLILTAIKGTSYSYQAAAGGAATYMLTGDASWLSIDEDTGLLTGTPTVAALYAVQVTAWNVGDTESSSQSFALRVTNSTGTLTGGGEPLYSHQEDSQVQYISTVNRLYIAYSAIVPGTGGYGGYVSYFNFIMNTWATPVHVMTYSDDDLHRELKVDLSPNGYVCCYGGNHHGDIGYWRGTSPYSIAAFTDLSSDFTSGDYTYGEMYDVGSAMYFMCRHGLSASQYTYVIFESINDGVTWERQQHSSIRAMDIFLYLTAMYQHPIEPSAHSYLRIHELR